MPRDHARQDKAYRQVLAAGERPLVGKSGQYDVLVHRSTRKPGWWQASFFDEEGPWGDTERASWTALLDVIRYELDWTTVAAATPTMFANPGHLPSIESLLEQADQATLDDFEDNYPQSASGELAEAAAEGPAAEDAYVARNVIWIGDAGRMMRVGPEYIQHIEGNIFYPDKLAAVVAGVRDSEDKIAFYAPYGTASQVDLQSVKESIEYAAYEDLDEPLSTGDEDLDRFLVDREDYLGDFGLPGDEEYEEARQEAEEALAQAVIDEDGDLGAWVVTVRDGNHRAFGSLLAAEPYVWVILEDNQYQDLMEAKKKGELSGEQKELLELLY